MTCNSQPARDCSLCPRLKGFIDHNRLEYSDYFNAPVPSFGDINAKLLVVGLAPGLKGANRTGRPFTGDYAGDVLYPALKRFGFADGEYGADPKDGLTLRDCRITNSVRCVPPENKPTNDEIKTCSRFLLAELEAMPNLEVMIALGNIAHASICRLAGTSPTKLKFAHTATHRLQFPWRKKPVLLLDSYHTSRYNMNTGRLTVAMFDDVIRKTAECLR